MSVVAMGHSIDSGLDHHRIEALACDLLEHMRDNYQAGPISRDRVYEALNALAFCVATVVQGSDPVEAQKFFDKALNMQLADLEKPSRWRKNMTEKEEAIVLANKVLDRISADPDDDLAILARQFLRSRQEVERLCDMLEKRGIEYQ